MQRSQDLFNKTCL